VVGTEAVRARRLSPVVVLARGGGQGAEGRGGRWGHTSLDLAARWLATGKTKTEEQAALGVRREGRLN